MYAATCSSDVFVLRVRRCMPCRFRHVPMLRFRDAFDLQHTSRQQLNNMLPWATKCSYYMHAWLCHHDLHSVHTYAHIHICDAQSTYALVYNRTPKYHTLSCTTTPRRTLRLAVHTGGRSCEPSVHHAVSSRSRVVKPTHTSPGRPANHGSPRTCPHAPVWCLRTNKLTNYAEHSKQLTEQTCLCLRTGKYYQTNWKLRQLARESERVEIS